MPTRGAYNPDLAGPGLPADDQPFALISEPARPLYLVDVALQLGISRAAARRRIAAGSIPRPLCKRGGKLIWSRDQFPAA
jgi:hypothetical protein